MDNGGMVGTFKDEEGKGKKQEDEKKDLVEGKKKGNWGMREIYSELAKHTWGRNSSFLLRCARGRREETTTCPLSPSRTQWSILLLLFPFLVPAAVVDDQNGCINVLKKREETDKETKEPKKRHWFWSEQNISQLRPLFPLVASWGVLFPSFPLFHIRLKWRKENYTVGSVRGIRFQGASPFSFLPYRVLQSGLGVILFFSFDSFSPLLLFCLCSWVPLLSLLLCPPQALHSVPPSVVFEWMSEHMNLKKKH